MFGIVVPSLLVIMLSANHKSTTLPALEVSMVKDGIEIYVGQMKVVCHRFNLDQAKQILVVEGNPVILHRNHAGEPRTSIRGQKITIDLTVWSVSIEGK